MKSQTAKKWLLMTFVIVVILAGVTWKSLPDENMHVYFLDVGQGDATLIVKGNIDILIDGGKTEVGVESTVIDMTVAPPKILRTGAISKEDIFNCL